MRFSMKRLALTLLIACAPAFARAECRLCAAVPSTGPALAPPVRALSIIVETMLDFSRAAQGRGASGAGTVAVDEVSGMRRVSGGLIDLGGLGLKGVVRLSGDPGRHVRVNLPASIRLMAADGGTAEVVDLRTDLMADPVLDANGALSFSFGGRLLVSGGAAGEFRGRIPITADYN
jgi:hypothetical protein